MMNYNNSISRQIEELKILRDNELKRIYCEQYADTKEQIRILRNINQLNRAISELKAIIV